MELRATRLDVDGAVATVFLHRPHRHNAWTGRMHTELRWLLAELEADPAVRAVVLTGTPPAFSVGGDRDALADHAARGHYDSGLPPEPAQPGYGVRPELDHDFAHLFGMRLPVIAAVNGACAGIAFSLVTFCDVRFVAAGAKVTTAAPRLGLPAEYGISWTLPRLVGLTRAADLLLSGRIVTGAETADWGLWNGVAADGATTLAMATEYARALVANASPGAVRMTKRQLYDDVLSADVGAAVDRAGALLDKAMGTAEYGEGVAALREKRAPRW